MLKTATHGAVLLLDQNQTASRRPPGDSEKLWADRMATSRRRILPRCALSTVDCGIDAHSGFDG